MAERRKVVDLVVDGVVEATERCSEADRMRFHKRDDLVRQFCFRYRISVHVLSIVYE